MATTLQDDIVRKVQTFLRDSRRENRVLDKIETTPEQIYDLLDDVLEALNKTPPPTTFVMSDLPKALLRDLVVIEVLKSAGIWYSRNEMPYSSGGVTIRDFEGKDTAYINWCSVLARKAEALQNSLKVTSNIHSIL